LQLQINPVAVEPVSFHYDDPCCFKRIYQSVYNHLVENDPQAEREPVYVCIGTDRATGDCLGPLVGSRLKSLVPFAQIFGTQHSAGIDYSYRCLSGESGSYRVYKCQERQFAAGNRS
jgi:hypothetical protein